MEAARIVWDKGGRTAAGNGAIMRCSPVALRWPRSPQRLVEESRRSAAITHCDPRCIWSVVALNAALVRSLRGEDTDLNLLADALDSANAPREIGEATRLADRCTLGNLQLDDIGSMGYTVKTMQVGLWTLSQPSDFETVLIQVVAAGGDTDTNGAVAGAIMGSRVGYKGIPSRWLDRIPESDRLQSLAHRLLDRCNQEQ